MLKSNPVYGLKSWRPGLEQIKVDSSEFTWTPLAKRTSILTQESLLSPYNTFLKSLTLKGSAAGAHMNQTK